MSQYEVLVLVLVFSSLVFVGGYPLARLAEQFLGDHRMQGEAKAADWHRIKSCRWADAIFATLLCAASFAVIWGLPEKWPKTAVSDLSIAVIFLELGYLSLGSRSYRLTVARIFRTVLITGRSVVLGAALIASIAVHAWWFGILVGVPLVVGWGIAEYATERSLAAKNSYIRSGLRIVRLR